MNAYPGQGLADALCDLDVKDRTPSYSEFQKASPCMQRAIKRRWEALGKTEAEEKQIHEKEARYFRAQEAEFKTEMAIMKRQREESERAEWLRRVRNGDWDKPDDTPSGWNDDCRGEMHSSEWGR